MTAETAVALPVLIVLAAALAWLVALGVSQARVVDAARETARALARGDDLTSSIAQGRRIAPDGATFHIVHEGSTILVDVSARVGGPGGVFAFVPGFSASSSAAAEQEATE